MSFDPRVTPARPDLAAAHLRGQVQAARFVEGTDFEVLDPVAPVRTVAGARCGARDRGAQRRARHHLRPGRRRLGLGPAPRRRLCRLAADERAARARRAADPPGRGAAHASCFPGRSIKAPAGRGRCRWAAGSPSPATTANWRGSPPAAYVPARHLAPLDAAAPDFVAVAERFIGVPYLWGGKTSLGIDCSGLVQVALTACGIVCPRDSDMQRALGTAVAVGDFAALRRGDLVFWKGHVAIMRDAATLLHANAFHMAVAAEPVRGSRRADRRRRQRGRRGQAALARRHVGIVAPHSAPVLNSARCDA